MTSWPAKIVLPLALLIAGCAGQRPSLPVAVAPAPAGSHLKLADWNMEFLAARNGAGCHPRGDADYAAIRRTVDAIDADVFAFEEVENEAAAARVFDPSRYTIVMETRDAALGGSCGGEHPNQLYIRQAVGIAIRKGLAFERKPDLAVLALGNPNLRSGVEVLVRPDGGEPLRILAIHLKSGCFQGDVGPACPTLLHQLPVMKAWVRAAAAEGTRFAIMGDWNRRLALPHDLFWSAIDAPDPAAPPGLILADAGVRARCEPRFVDFIDHVVLDRRAGAQTSGFSETTFPHGGNPSDHCPISLYIAR